MSTFDSDAEKPTEPEIPEPLVAEEDILPCARCGALPKDCVWQCRRCGAVASVIPYPVIGCACIAMTYVCDTCLRTGDE